MVGVEGRCAVSKHSTIGYGSADGPSPQSRAGLSNRIGPRPRKSLGQHFLTDGRVLSRIVGAAGLSSEDLVLEIGPGPGALTRKLVERAGRVVALEMDEQLAAALPSRLDNPPNLTSVQGDARTVDLAALIGPGMPYKVVANLPYYAANPIVRRFMESPPKPKLIVVMVQQEVAQAMLAKPGRMSILSVATQYYAIPSLVCNVPPRAFRPPPKVTSSVVRLELRPRPALEVADPGPFFDLVRAGFSAPRKQLRNSLSQGLGVSPAEVERLLMGLQLDGKRRAETLTLDEWGLIYFGWEARRKVGSLGAR